MRVAFFAVAALATALGALPAEPAGGESEPLWHKTAQAPVKVCFELPGTHDGVVGVTVIATDPSDPGWIVTHLSYARPFNAGLRIQNRFPPPECFLGLVLSIEMGCTQIPYENQTPRSTRQISYLWGPFSAPKFWSPGST